MNASLNLSLLPEGFAVCRFDREAAVPDWFDRGSFYSITRTDDELSLVCKDKGIPEGVVAERGWRALKVAGPLDFALVGVVARLTSALAEAGVSIFVLSTYDTDYILVKENALETAVTALRTFCTVRT